MKPPTHEHPARIGVFDSGLGGLSVLRAIREHLPRHPLMYVADSGHAPYGDRGDAFVEQRTLAISRFLLEQGAQCIVIACNTATTAAVSSLRAHFPTLPIVGVEPGIKPAAALTRNQRVGVMATTGTLRSERFRLLAQAHAAHVELLLQACPGLADAIESGDLDAPRVVDLVTRYCEPLRTAGVDTVVLGCTHYAFVADHIQRALGPAVQLIDTAVAVARQTAALNSTASGSALSASASCASPSVHMWTTGAPDTLAKVSRDWLGWDCQIGCLPAPLV